MKLKRNLVFLILTVISLTFIGFTPSDTKLEEKPNLLFIFPDQFRPQSMGFVNEDPVHTPNIDRLASEGMVFSNAVSNRPLCSPYRAMLMTGKYPFSNGVQTNVNTSSRKFGNFLEEDEICFGDVLKANGYYAGYIGKWHLDPPKGPDVENWQDAVWSAFTPPDKRHGFDFWHAYGCHNRHNDPYYWETNACIEDTLFPGEWSPIHEAKVASRFIEKNKGKPWALFVSMNPPHGPYHEVPEKYRDIYKNIATDSLLNRPNVPEGTSGDIGHNNVIDYFACVSGVDEQIGKILDKLEKTGQAENTIVVFTADHGEMMGSHGLLQKVVYYEESFRVPFIARWPGKLKPEESSLHLSAPDIMPTLLGLMGVKEDIPTDIEGDDYSKTFRGIPEETPEFALYINSSFSSALGGMRGLRNDRYTFVIQRNNSGEIINTILFDNKNDPFQLDNIAKQHPTLVDKFESQVFEKLAEINDPWIKYAPH
ncbi:MAG: sulfatase family protein [Bacteroidota bacterium]